MIDTETRGAIDRIRRHKSGERLTAIYGGTPRPLIVNGELISHFEAPETLSAWHEDTETLNKLCLRDYLPDDDQPMDGDWLHCRAGFTLSFHPQGIEPSEYYTLGQLIFDNHTKTWKLGNIDLTGILRTRGDLRRLCRVLQLRMPPQD